jgi:hypothetical protein
LKYAFARDVGIRFVNESRAILPVHLEGRFKSDTTPYYSLSRNVTHVSTLRTLRTERLIIGQVHRNIGAAAEAPALNDAIIISRRKRTPSDSKHLFFLQLLLFPAYRYLQYSTAGCYDQHLFLPAARCVGNAIYSFRNGANHFMDVQLRQSESSSIPGKPGWHVHL